MKQIDDITKVPVEELRYCGYKVVAVYKNVHSDYMVVFTYGDGRHGFVSVDLAGCKTEYPSGAIVIEHCPPFKFPSGVGEALRYCMEGGAFKTRTNKKLVVVGDYRIANKESGTLRIMINGFLTSYLLLEMNTLVVDYWDEERDVV